MKSERLIKTLSNNSIDYVIYGNFNFINGENEDIDLLIKNEDYNLLKQFLLRIKLEFHERKYYPDQIFITGTNIKLHVVDNLYIGGRNVAYLIKLNLIDEIFKTRVKYKSYYIIDYSFYFKYRVLKKIFNPLKNLKLDEYPMDGKMYNTFDIILKLILIMLYGVATNLIYIPIRFLKKRVWVRYIQ